MEAGRKEFRQSDIDRSIRSAGAAWRVPCALAVIAAAACHGRGGGAAGVDAGDGVDARIDAAMGTTDASPDAAVIARPPRPTGPAGTLTVRTIEVDGAPVDARIMIVDWDGNPVADFMTQRSDGEGTVTIPPGATVTGVRTKVDRTTTHDETFVYLRTVVAAEPGDVITLVFPHAPGPHPEE